MAGSKKKAMNRRKPQKSGTRFPKYLVLVLVLAVVGVAVYVLQPGKKAPSPEARHETAAPHMKLPPRADSTAAPQAPVVTETPETEKAPAPEKETAAPEPRRRKNTAQGVKANGSVAIILDDMGSSMKEVQSLISIHLPLTFSVIPSLGRARGVAEAAHQAGEEVMVHMPMEPQGYPRIPMEKIGLLVTMDSGEIEKRVNSYFGSVPYAVGANNHMGSRFTEQQEKMEPVLKVLKEKGVFFVDSRTSQASVGYEVARDAGVKCASRQVFLDNVQNVAAIRKQLSQAAAIARKGGGAIAIGHPHPTTIQALQEMMPELANEGIKFVHASDMVK